VVPEEALKKNCGGNKKKYQRKSTTEIFSMEETGKNRVS
jgi:hypothetical protein